MLLTSTQSLELTLAAAITTSQPTYISNYIDENASSFALGTLGCSDGVANSTANVTIVAAPSAGIVRKVSGISVYNLDTIATILKISLNDNGTRRIIFRGLLINGETLIYSDLRGFIILTALGELRVNIDNLPTATSSGGGTTVPAHASTHELGGSDPIPIDTLSTQSDTTNLNATTGYHGLLKKLSGTASEVLNGVGNWIASTTLAISAANLSGTITSATQDLITRLGTIVSGVWNGTKIGLAYGGTNADLSATGGTSKFLKQATAGAAITVVQPASSDLSDSANIPLINANNHFTGSGDQTFDGNIRPATTQMMSWTSKSAATVYQAASDGLVIASFTADEVGAQSINIDGYTDSSNPPTTIRITDGASDSGGVPRNYRASITFPVRKGDYWKVSWDSGGGGTFRLYWIPLGTAG